MSIYKIGDKVRRTHPYGVKGQFNYQPEGTVGTVIKVYQGFVDVILEEGGVKGTLVWFNCWILPVPKEEDELENFMQQPTISRKGIFTCRIHFRGETPLFVLKNNQSLMQWL